MGNCFLKVHVLVLTPGLLRVFAISFPLRGCCEQLPPACSRGCLRAAFLQMKLLFALEGLVFNFIYQLK